MSPWQIVLAWIGTVITVLLTNFLVAVFYAGKYRERVERLTSEMNRYQDKADRAETRMNQQEKDFLTKQIEIYKELAAYGKMIAAFTGRANGINFRKGEEDL